MTGSIAGGKKCAATNIANHGEDYYRNIGRLGGKVCCKKGFAVNPELAKLAGAKGGRMSKRGKAKK